MHSKADRQFLMLAVSVIGLIVLVAALAAVFDDDHDDSYYYVPSRPGHTTVRHTTVPKTYRPVAPPKLTKPTPKTVTPPRKSLTKR